MLRTGPTTRAAPVLRVRNLSVMRGGRTIVDDASFTLEPGQILLLKGENGVGKTTLLRAVAGLSPVAGGEIQIDGGDTRSLVYCGHADAVKAALTVRENLRFWHSLYGSSQDRVADVLSAFALAKHAHTPVAQLSAGQRRRLGLARALVSARPIWLLDEPAASMDAPSIARLSELLLRHASQGGSALIATHDSLAVAGARTLHIGSAP